MNNFIKKTKSLLLFFLIGMSMMPMISMNLAYADKEPIIGDSFEVTEATDEIITDGAKLNNVSNDGLIANPRSSELYNGNGELTVKKVWRNVDALDALPVSIRLELMANGELMQTADMFVFQNRDWTYTFSGLPKYKDGEEIVYSVHETRILGADDATFIVYGREVTEDGVQRSVEGQWIPSIDGYEITNTWLPATSEYSGKDRFRIKKVDDSGKTLSGVGFEVNGVRYETDSNGEFEIYLPSTPDVREDDIVYVIKEVDELEGYDMADDEAIVNVKSTSTFMGVEEEALRNVYAKYYQFIVNGDESYVWNEETKTLTVINKRSLAKSLKIRKEISGAKAKILRERGLTFTITGPDDFVAQKVMFKDFKKVDEGVYEYELLRAIPTGKYTVTESGVGFERVWQMEMSEDDGDTKEVRKDDAVVFTMNSDYIGLFEPDEEMVQINNIREDAGWEGDQVIPTIPNTGSLTKVGGFISDGALVANVGVLMVTLTSVAVGLGMAIIIAKRS